MENGLRLLASGYRTQIWLIGCFANRRSELEVKVVNTKDMTRVMYLREQTRPAKHVAFDRSGSTLAVSATDGMIYLYSLSSEQPQLLKRIDGVISTTNSTSDASVAAAWHPDSRAFAAPDANQGIAAYSVSPLTPLTAEHC